MYTFEQQVAMGDFAHLNDKDDYSRYFNLVLVTLSRLMAYANKDNEHKSFIREIKPFIDRLMYTMKVLRMRHLHNPEHNLSLDLNESGFPHYVNIFNFRSDLKIRDEALAGLPALDRLKDQLVTSLLNGDDTASLLRVLGEVSYYTALDEDQLFLDFVPGTIRCTDEKEGGKMMFTFSWGCYGNGVNLPYFHSMVFEVDAPQTGFQDNPALLKQFLDAIRFSGHNIPSLSVLSHEIDDHLEWVHPKIVQRVQIGPIYAPVIQHPESGSEFVQLLEKYGEEDDCVLELLIEAVISQGSKKISSGLLDLGKGKVREVFLLKSNNLEARQEKLSGLKKRLIIPHRVLQNVPSDAEFFKPYKTYKAITYTKGVMNVS